MTAPGSARLESCFEGVEPAVRAALERRLEGRDIDWRACAMLLCATGRELSALVAVADELRRREAGDRVGYVVNRNVNFTNVCVKACKFCAFSRAARSEEAYFLGEDEIVRRVVEARELGATEVCLQAGLAPDMDGRFYARLCRAIKAALPDVHIHAFSPEEVKYGAELSRASLRDYLLELREAGLGSLPGTSAEILDDDVRARIAPGRITTDEWIEVVRTAHAIGLPTTSTIMFGHVETEEHRARHLDRLRDIQRETGGFTELVPLSFVHDEAPMTLRGQMAGLRRGPSGHDVVRLFAAARVFLGGSFKNIQASWVKEGIRTAGWLLSCGANDLGGTLMNESISTSAGAAHGQRMTPAELRAAIRDAGRVPYQRDTLYRSRRDFPAREPEEGEPLEPLDRLEDAESTLGSYAALTREERYRFQLVRPGLAAGR